MIILRTPDSAISFSIRKIGKYYDVDVTLNDTKVSLGLHDDDQRLALAKTLKSAIYDLLDSGEYKELMEET